MTTSKRRKAQERKFAAWRQQREVYFCVKCGREIQDSPHHQTCARCGREDPPPVSPAVRRLTRLQNLVPLDVRDRVAGRVPSEG